jgi:hypothetical protein
MSRIFVKVPHPLPRKEKAEYKGHKEPKHEPGSVEVRTAAGHPRGDQPIPTGQHDPRLVLGRQTEARLVTRMLCMRRRSRAESAVRTRPGIPLLTTQPARFKSG